MNFNCLDVVLNQVFLDRGFSCKPSIKDALRRFFMGSVFNW